MNKPDIYDAALYLRLSKDDVEEGGAKSESNSIANQRELLRSFVKSQPDIQIFDIYVDDGYSGGNFDRPEFKRMTTDIEAGKVNCVIVKDLSRFGREYIEAGRWIEKTYPALNVRFISVTDQFDSKTADFSEKSFVVPIKNFVNESYCRDISGKVRSHQKIKREKGEFMKGALEAGNEVEKIVLKDKTVHPCTGCSVCSMYGKPCPQKDDAAEIVEKMIAADVIVMATPVYFYTMCGQMKIMIDRCCARYTEITNKEFYFIIAAAEDNKAMMERTIDGFRGFLDCLEGPQEKGTVYGIGAWKVGEIKDTPYMQEAYNMGKMV